MKKRIMALLTVVALMTSMLAIAVVPASAGKFGTFRCTNPAAQDSVLIHASDKKEWKALGYTECTNP